MIKLRSWVRSLAPQTSREWAFAIAGAFVTLAIGMAF